MSSRSPNMMTGQGVFAGGDMVPDERTVTVGIGHGKKAARHINGWLRGSPEDLAQERAGDLRQAEHLVLPDAPRTERPARRRPAAGDPEVVQSLDEDNGAVRGSGGLRDVLVRQPRRLPDNAVIARGEGEPLRDRPRLLGRMCVSECPSGAIEMVPEEIRTDPTPRRSTRCWRPAAGLHADRAHGPGGDLLRRDRVRGRPAGRLDRRAGRGSYRLRRSDDGAIFNHNVGPNSWKSHLFPASLKLWKAQRNGNGLQVEEEPAGQGAPYAFIGVRSCDMHAIAVQDKTFVEGPWAPTTRPAARAPSSSPSTAPRPAAPASASRWRPVPRPPSALTSRSPSCSTTTATASWSRSAASGAEVLQEVDTRPSADGDERAADRVLAETAASMGRSLDTTDTRDLLYRNREHPRWDEGRPLPDLRQLHPRLPDLLAAASRT